MNKELQDDTWAKLAREVKKQIIDTYQAANNSVKYTLQQLFGRHNIDPNNYFAFKVGDKVIIKKNAAEYHQEYNNGYAWLPFRDQFLGKLATITKICYGRDIQLDITGDTTWWSQVDLYKDYKRIFKFRGKSLVTKKWVYDSTFQIGCDYAAYYNCVGELEDIDLNTVGIYIGLSDINNIDIYEGDIIESNNHKYEICYYDEIASFVAEDIDSGEPEFISSLENIEIIGNIYDNGNR